MSNLNGGEFSKIEDTTTNPTSLLTTDDIVLQLGLDVIERLNLREMIKRLTAKVAKLESETLVLKKAQADVEMYKTSATRLDEKLRAMGDELTRVRQELAKEKADHAATSTQLVRLREDYNNAQKQLDSTIAERDKLAEQVALLTTRMAENKSKKREKKNAERDQA